MATTKWVIDSAHSEINFRVKHMMISTVTGGIVLADKVRIHCHVELIKQ